MTTSLLKKITTAASAQGTTDRLLDTVEGLIMIKKKFGKQLGQPTVIDFVAQQFPEIYDLYMLLGGSKTPLRMYLLLRQYLRQSLGEDYLYGTVSHDVDNLPSDISIAGRSDNPSLMIQSPHRTYRRSLYEDLEKLTSL